MKIVATNPVFPETERRLAALGNVTVNRALAPWSRAELAGHLRDADAVMAFMTDTVDVALLAGCPSLRVIACALKGYDNIDVDACTDAGVWVTIVPDLLTVPTAELAVALTLGLNRNLLAGDARVRAGTFQGWRADLYGFGLHGATVGIAGVGRVGLAIARRLQGFGAELIGYDERALPEASLLACRMTQVVWEELIARSDVVIIALPLVPRTVHLFDAETLGRMRPGARLVNVGRGSVVDEAAVAQSLANGHLGGYAADVFELEDRGRSGRPDQVSGRLTALRDRTLFTPHLGSAVAAVRLAIERSAVDDIAQVFGGGAPTNAVNVPAPRRAACPV